VKTPPGEDAAGLTGPRRICDNEAGKENGVMLKDQSIGRWAMAVTRKAGWFVVVAVLMAGWMGVLGSIRGVAEAGVIASSIEDAASRASRTGSSSRS